MGEVVVSLVFGSLAIEATKAPDVSVFQRMQKNWDIIPQNNTREFSRFEINQCKSTAGQKLLLSLKEEVIKISKNTINFRRNDYQEFAHCAFHSLVWNLSLIEKSPC